MDERGREALLEYVLRPPIAQERVTRGPEVLVRIALKKRFSDGTFAVDLDPLSLLTRASVRRCGCCRRDGMRRTPTRRRQKRAAPPTSAGVGARTS